MNGYLQEYNIIASHYSNKRARRSKILYMNHINEGLKILEDRKADDYIKGAYCIHPLIQDDKDLIANLYELMLVNNMALIYSMEYRNVANRGLYCYQVDNPEHIYLSPLPEVNEMLIADKVQNRKDFELYHKGSHPKSKELDRYFRNWLRRLDITEAQYDYYVNLIEATK